MIEGPKNENGIEKPKQSLEQYLRAALQGSSGGLDSAYWKHLKLGAHNTGAHALVELQLKQKERAKRENNSEEFTIHDLGKCPPESVVAGLIEKYYEQQGYLLNKEETTSYADMVLQRPNDKKKIYVGVTTSPGENGATVIVTSAII